MKKTMVLATIGMVVAILGMGLSVDAAECTNVIALVNVPVTSGSTPPAQSYTVICIPTQPLTSGQCTSGEVAVASPTWVTPPAGTVIVGSSIPNHTGQISTTTIVCAEASTDASVTCPSGSAKVLLTNPSNASETETKCVTTSNPLATPTCASPLPTSGSAIITEPDSNGQCAGNNLINYLMCAPPNTGTPSDPTAAKHNLCVCAPGQTFQSVPKCVVTYTPCPDGQAKIDVIATMTPSISYVAKCVPFTPPDSNETCASNQVSLFGRVGFQFRTQECFAIDSNTNCPTGTQAIVGGNCVVIIIKADANGKCATGQAGSFRSVCMTSSAEKLPGDTCPSGTVLQDVKLCAPNLTSQKTDSNTGLGATTDTNQFNQQSSTGGGSCSLIRQP